MRGVVGLAVLAAVALALACAPGARSAAADEAWWREGVVYQVYPRSFKDGCSPKCTGIGSLRGINSKLQYLKKELGVSILWLSPIYDSPMKDFGYDISNFTGIWPEFGTLADFDELLAAAKKIGLRLLMDFVPNHSSDKHPWFQESMSNRTSAKRDWYMWHDPVYHDKATTGKGSPPNNWKTLFCKDKECSAWTYHEATGQYYYHAFLAAQPDLNWRNPEVKEAMKDVLRFWLRRGVDGFRVDAFANILEDPQLRNESKNPKWHGNPVKDGYESLIHTQTENWNGGPGEGLHGIVAEMQATLEEFGGDKMLIGEIYPDNVISEADVISYYGSQDTPQFSMPFNMNLVLFFGGTWDGSASHTRNGTKLQALMAEYYSLLPDWAQPNFVVGNHDVHRIRTRLGSEGLARVVMTLLLTARGTPTMYNGDEFGQQDGYVPAGERQDPNCIVAYNGSRCRDPERTPLQWDASSANAGFTAAGVKPWLPVSTDYKHTNVAAQLGDKDSFLGLTRRLLALRANTTALHRGDLFFEPVTPEHAAHGEQILAYVRKITEDHVVKPYLVVHNLGTAPVVLDCRTSHSKALHGTTVLDSHDASMEGVTVLLGTLKLKGEHSVVVKLPEEDRGTPTGFSRFTAIIVGSVLGGVLLLFLAFLGVRWFRQRRASRDYDLVVNYDDEA